MSSTGIDEAAGGTLGIVRESSGVDKRQNLNTLKLDDDSKTNSGLPDEGQDLHEGSDSLATRIRSTNTSYDDASSPGMTKPTFVPNNTPVQSPPNSPHLQDSSTQTTQPTRSTTKSSTLDENMLQNSQSSSCSLPIVPPTSTHFPPIRLREVLCNDDNGGCLPPKPENISARGGENDHVLIKQTILSRTKDGSNGMSSSHLEKDNSPISIINRRNLFNTSDSRSSGSNQPLNGLLAPTRTHDMVNKEENITGDETIKNEDNEDGSPAVGSSQNTASFVDRKNSSSEYGIAPTSFYFDKDRSITDPHVKHDQSNEKITISSWLSSKQNAEIYSLIDENNNSINNNDTNNNEGSRNRAASSGSNKRPYSSDGFTSPQPPRSALSMSSSLGGVGGLDLTDTTPNAISRTKSFGDVGIDEDDQNYVPPPPPRFINSKLDGLRTRLLVNPRGTPSKYEEDIGTATAAAVLSNMRSSPFRFSDRSRNYLNNANTNNNSTNNSNNSNSVSRPGSSSFSSTKSFPRPIIRVHQRESPIEDANENAILDDEDNDDDDEEEYENVEGQAGNENNGKTASKNSKRSNRRNETKISSSKVRKVKDAKNMKDQDVNKEVTWNKNGKRVTPRKLLESASRRRRAKAKTTGKVKDFKDDVSHSDTGKEDEDSKEDDDDEEYSLKTETSAQHKKNSMGSRSRTGCWICRLRKKKCTEERPRCYNCERLNLECNYELVKPDFVSDPAKKQMKLEEIKQKTKEAKRNAMRKKPFP